MKGQYRLYAVEQTDETIKKAEKRRFFRANAEYILLFSPVTPKGATEITPNEMWRLTEEERKWLAQCVSEVLAEEIEKSYPKTLQAIGEYLDKTEAALKQKLTEWEEKSHERGNDGT